MTYLFIYLTPILNFLLFETLIFNAPFFFIALPLSSLLLVTAVAKITGKRITSAEFWNFCIFPALFSGFVAIYSLFIVNTYLIHILYAANLIFTLYYLKNIYQGVKGKFLENISSYGNFLTVFFSFSTIYALKSFLNTPIWLLVILAAAITLLIVHQIFWANNVHFENGAPYIFLSCLIIVQIAWAIYFLPFNYNALGLILAICYYMLIGLIKANFGGKLSSRNLKFYLVSGIGCLAIILLTAKWA